MQKLLAKFNDEVLVVKNFLSLVVIKLANFVMPLFTLPYIIRTIGVDNVGAINLASSIMVYMAVIAMFGFNFSGTKFIARYSSDVNKCSQYYSGAIFLQFLLLVFSFIALSLLIFLVPVVQEIKLICYLSFGVVVGQVLNSIWLFQGMQTMKYITAIDLLAKAAFTALIFIFVKERDDYWLVPLFTVLGAISSGLICQIIIRKKLKIKISFKKTFKLRFLMKYINDGKDIFIQQVFVSIYGPLTILFLGVYTSTQHVGYYTIAEKLISIPIMLIIVAVQAYYPYAVKLYEKNIELYKKQIIYIVCAITLSMTIMSLIIIGFHDLLYLLFTGKQDDLGSRVLYILGFGLAFSSLGQFLTQVFITIDKQRTLTKISLITMVITCTVSPFVIQAYGVIGLSFYTVVRQFFVISMCLSIIYLYFTNNKRTVDV